MCSGVPEVWTESTDLPRSINRDHPVTSSVFFSFTYLGSEMSLFWEKGSASPGVSFSGGEYWIKGWMQHKVTLALGSLRSAVCGASPRSAGL